MNLPQLQELEQMKSRIARDEVNVEVDSASGPELGTILSGLRSQYEGIVKKNKDQTEQWYLKKVRSKMQFSTKYKEFILRGQSNVFVCPTKSQTP